MGGQVPRRCRPHLRSCAWLSAPSNRPATPKISPSSHLESSSNVRLPAVEPTIKPMTGPNKPRAITRPTRALIEPTKPLSHWPHRPLQLVMASSASLASSAWLYRPQEPRLSHWHWPHRPCWPVTASSALSASSTWLQWPQGHCRLHWPHCRRAHRYEVVGTATSEHRRRPRRQLKVAPAGEQSRQPRR